MENEKTILKKMHSLHLILAEELKRICDKHGLRYFMIAGTMLGAIRHKGFIPWDDDMDFGMPRQDFERFLQVAENEIDTNEFFLETDRKEQNYVFNFAKLRLNGTEILESFSCSTNTHHGIYIDIFPIDTVPDNRIKKFFQFTTFYVARNLLWVKCGYGTEDRKKKITFKIAKGISTLFSVSTLKKIKNDSITRYNDEGSTYVVTSDGNSGLQHETLKREWTESLEDFEFNGRMYPGFSDFDAYLKFFYDDYMQLPPENQRNHHQRLSVDLGKYDKFT